MAGNGNSGGRNAKSPAMHLLQGTFRKDRHSDYETPEPPKGRPVPPKKLTGDARLEWDRMVARLEQVGSLSDVDDATLYQYVRLFAEVEDTRADFADIGPLVTTLKRRALRKLDGQELVDAIEKVVELQKLKNRLKVQAKAGALAIRQYLVEFGITTTSRVRVKTKLAESTVSDAKKERFFGRGSTLA
jgi:P27 family predicted phage terminase small subunit